MIFLPGFKDEHVEAQGIPVYLQLQDRSSGVFEAGTLTLSVFLEVSNQGRDGCRQGIHSIGEIQKYYYTA